jgi:hypothetical protein
MSVRFSPEVCPGCGEPLQPKYSTYRHGTRGLLFPLGLIGGLFAVPILLGVSFVVAFVLASKLFGNAGLKDREFGVLIFLIQLPMFAVVALLARGGFRLLNRLPRTFTAGCETCTWTGPCKVYENAEV